MPSPIAHSLIGYFIYRIASRPFREWRWFLIILYLFAAIIPDLGFIPGFIAGNVNLYYHGISHSIGFAVLFAFVFTTFFDLIKRSPIWRNFIIFFSLYFSHIILDYLSMDNTAPYREPFFWPLSSEYYIAPFAFSPDIQRDASTSKFFC
jgi:membrane-bound metal-dependent hydrolase YbcI (DUF457 family)